MYVGTSIFLIALGAILRYAVSTTVEGINLSVVGLILMVVGAIALVASLIQMAAYRNRTVRVDRVDRVVEY